MSDDKFLALTKPLSITGTSFKLNLGLKNNKWALEIYKGNDILDFNVFDIPQKQFPDQNLIVQWILQKIVIPNINPHQIMKTLQILTKEALESKKKLVTSEDYIRRQLAKKKQKQSMRIQLQDLKEKLKFLNIILGLIDNGATGQEILNEYKNHPTHQVGILRSYDLTMKKIGEQKFLDYIDQERKEQSEFKRLNSAVSYLNVLETEKGHIEERILTIEEELEEKR